MHGPEMSGADILGKLSVLRNVLDDENLDNREIAETLINLSTKKSSILTLIEANQPPAFLQQMKQQISGTDPDHKIRYCTHAVNSLLVMPVCASLGETLNDPVPNPTKFAVTYDFAQGAIAVESALAISLIDTDRYEQITAADIARTGIPFSDQLIELQNWSGVNELYRGIYLGEKRRNGFSVVNKVLEQLRGQIYRPGVDIGLPTAINHGARSYAQIYKSFFRRL